MCLFFFFPLGIERALWQAVMAVSMLHEVILSCDLVLNCIDWYNHISNYTNLITENSWLVIP